MTRASLPLLSSAIVLFFVMCELANTHVLASHNASQPSSCLLKCLAGVYGNTFFAESMRLYSRRKGFKTLSYGCEILTSSAVPCSVDIEELFVSIPHDNNVQDTSLGVSFSLHCKGSPRRIYINNTNNISMKAPILVFMLINCGVSIKDIAVLGNATYLYTLFSVSTHTESGTSFVPLHTVEDETAQERTNTNLGLRDISQLGWAYAHSNNARGQETIGRSSPSSLDAVVGYKWPKLTTLFIENSSIAGPLDEVAIRESMPLLQWAEITGNFQTEPPNWILCKGGELQYLPRNLTRLPNNQTDDIFKLPIDVIPRGLQLDRNQIKNLSNYQFSGVLTSLYLTRNYIEAIGTDTFRNLSEIRLIYLEKNRLNVLQEGVFAGLNTLLTLKLGHNNISSISEETFIDLTELELLDLAHNNLEYIQRGLFKSLKNLHYLLLNNNKIHIFEAFVFPESFPRLLFIDIRNNFLKIIPQELLVLPRIRVVALGFNRIDFNAFMDVLISLSLTNIIRRTQVTNIGLDNNDVREYTQTRNVTLNKLHSVLHWYRFNLANNPIVCNCQITPLRNALKTMLINGYGSDLYYNLNLFCESPVTARTFQIVDLRDDQLICKYCPAKCLCFYRYKRILVVDCEGRGLTGMPAKLPESSGELELRCAKNTIQSVPPLKYLKNVTRLYLGHNKLNEFNATSLSLLHQLKVLYLDANNISKLPRAITHLRLDKLALALNPFECSCQNMWMKSWLLNNTAVIVNVSNVLCNGGTKIITTPNEVFGCLSHKITSGKRKEMLWATISIVEVILFALVFGLSLLAFKNRRNIKVFFYIKFNWHPFDKQDDDNPAKIYDAFISYSSYDSNWVVQTLTRRLEAHEPPYRLCIHYRDFQVGASIQENIMRRVEESKRTILVLSRQFLRSEWCLLEFRAAHTRALRERTHHLIVIVMEPDIGNDEMDEELQLYMCTNTYMQVNDRWFWPKLFYVMAQVARVREAQYRRANRLNGDLIHGIELVAMAPDHIDQQL